MNGICQVLPVLTAAEWVGPFLAYDAAVTWALLKTAWHSRGSINLTGYGDQAIGLLQGLLIAAPLRLLWLALMGGGILLSLMNWACGLQVGTFNPLEHAHRVEYLWALLAIAGAIWPLGLMALFISAHRGLDSQSMARALAAYTFVLVAPIASFGFVIATFMP